MPQSMPESTLLAAWTGDGRIFRLEAEYPHVDINPEKRQPCGDTESPVFKHNWCKSGETAQLTVLRTKCPWGLPSDPACSTVSSSLFGKHTLLKQAHRARDCTVLSKVHRSTRFSVNVRKYRKVRNSGLASLEEQGDYGLEAKDQGWTVTRAKRAKLYKGGPFRVPKRRILTCSPACRPVTGAKGLFNGLEAVKAEGSRKSHKARLST